MKLPEIWLWPPVIGSIDARRRDHLVVEDDGERPADIVGRGPGPTLRAGRVEAHADDRLLGARVKRRLCIDEVAAGHDDALLDQVGPAALLPWCRKESRTPAAAARRAPARATCSGPPSGTSSLAVVSKIAEQALRVAEPGHLDQNPVYALALDHRLDGAELIDAPCHDLDRLIDCLADALKNRCLGPGETHEAIADIVDFHRALAGVGSAGRRAAAKVHAV